MSGIGIANNIIRAKVDDTSTEFDSSGNISVKDGGITAAMLASNAVTTAKILNGNVTKAKIENVANMKVLGNVSGAAAAPAEVAIIDDDTMATATATNIPTAESVKAYAESYANSLLRVKAHCRFNGANGSIIGGFNIASVSRTGTGAYAINFTEEMDTDTYTVLCTGFIALTDKCVTIRQFGQAVGGITITTFVGTQGDGSGLTQADLGIINIVVFE